MYRDIEGLQCKKLGVEMAVCRRDRMSHEMRMRLKIVSIIKSQVSAYICDSIYPVVNSLIRSACVIIAAPAREIFYIHACEREFSTKCVCLTQNA